MLKSLTYIGLQLFLIVSMVNAAEPHGFGPLTFGDGKESSIQKLIEKYGFEQKVGAIQGKNGSQLNNSQKTVWITNFPLGKNNKVIVWLYFNENEKFFRYEIESEAYALDKTNQEVRERALFFGKIFQTKYGLCEKKYDLSHLNLKEGYLSIYMKWKFPNYKAHIAYKLTGNQTNVVAFIEDSKLKAEKFVPPEIQKSDADIQDAVNAF